MNDFEGISGLGLSRVVIKWAKTRLLKVFLILESEIGITK
jgi:hypothetical protein